MQLLDNFNMMAKYNQWMNKRLYSIAATLDEVQLTRDLGAFFDSISGTFNHILVADIIWLKRFANHSRRFSSLTYPSSLPHPQSLAQILYPQFRDLKEVRVHMDQVIIDFINELNENDLGEVLHYSNTKGKKFNKQLGFLVLHFFNHQTHHRGQISTLLNQLEIDTGVTDLLAIIPESEKFNT